MCYRGAGGLTLRPQAGTGGFTLRPQAGTAGFTLRPQAGTGWRQDIRPRSSLYSCT